MKNNIEKILNQPSYWVEAINGVLYNAIVDYMKKNDLNRTQLAEVLGISKGRVSQILNDGEINFSIEKIVEISLKVGKFPSFELEDSVAYINKLKASTFVKTIKISNLNEYSTAVFEVEKSDTKVFSWNKFNEFKIAM
jgi:transcriptional regulator with XRE-family HTH domain